MWGVYPQDNGDVVVLPIGDIRDLDDLNSDCLCMPQITVVGANVVITHNAFDFRHVSEYLNEEIN